MIAGRDVVLLNGPAGVGKTTVGRRLAASARNGVCVHGDDLRRFVVTREPDAVHLAQLGTVVDARGPVDAVVAAARRQVGTGTALVGGAEA
jgi:MoxR-like ATPase